MRVDQSTIYRFVPGYVILTDPNRDEVAQIRADEFSDYLQIHNLSCETDIGRKSLALEYSRQVFPRKFATILRQIDRLPKVKLPLFTKIIGDAEFTGYGAFYSMDLIADFICQRFRVALNNYSYVCYQAGNEEDELMGIRAIWRNWFLDNVVPKLPCAEVFMPPGFYPGITGAVVRRKDAEPFEEFVKTIPDQDWQTWAPSDLLAQVY